MLLFFLVRPLRGALAVFPLLVLHEPPYPNPEPAPPQDVGVGFPTRPQRGRGGAARLLPEVFRPQIVGSSLYDGSIVNEANWVLTEAPERLKESHRAFYRWTQAGESIAYRSSGELRVGRCDLGVFVTSSKVSSHLEGS